VVTILLAAAGIYALVHWRQEADFRPLFTGLAAEDAAAIVQKVSFRLRCVTPTRPPC
jgi:flagellar biosynthesis/type III secretory pathway M-ring protein FliF/YscJ